jgi:hypothetical protein
MLVAACCCFVGDLTAENGAEVFDLRVHAAGLAAPRKDVHLGAAAAAAVQLSNYTYSCAKVSQQRCIGLRT